MWKVLLGCVVIIVGASSAGEVSRVVVTAQGAVRGYKDPVDDVVVFYNIQYAICPTGPNKFKAPLPPRNWSGIFEAVDKGIVCPQYKKPTFGISTVNKTMQDDCLIANIYVPNTNDTNLPVLVTVHGGGFTIGYGDLLTPKKFVSSKKIIAVNFNFRLGVHGFLSLGTSNVPGNAGLKDQVALLRWVQKNIANFGGNPDDVTVSGYSTGSCSANLLITSKLSVGLFHKVILESGVINSPMTMQLNPIQNAIDLAKLLNCDSYFDFDIGDVDIITALENFFINATLDCIQSGSILYQADNSFFASPSVEIDVGQEMFLDDDPVKLVRTGNFTNVPMLVGYTKMDGMVRSDVFQQWSAEMNVNFSKYLPSGLVFSCAKQNEGVATSIKTFYFGNKSVDNKTVLVYIDYFTDCMFACPTLRLTNDILSSGVGADNIYVYEYSYVDEATTPPIPYTNVYGAAHIAETFAVLDGINITHRDESNISTTFRDWKAKMRDIWYNFMINGKPSSEGLPDWEPITQSRSTYMALKGTPELLLSLRQTACAFWDEIFKAYYKYASPPQQLANDCP